MPMIDGKWDGFYLRGCAPEHIIFQDWSKKDPDPIPSRWMWEKFAEQDVKSCKYAGYENDAEGEDFPEGMLYIRYSLKTGKVTGVKYSYDDIFTVSQHWNDYDTPSGKTTGPCWHKYTDGLQIIEEKEKKW